MSQTVKGFSASSISIKALIIIAALPAGWPAWLIGAVFGIVFVIVGVIGLILFYGLWNLKSWAWFWTMVANILGIISSIGNFWANIISIVLSVVIVVYLLMPGIKDHFR